MDAYDGDPSSRHGPDGAGGATDSAEPARSAEEDGVVEPAEPAGVVESVEAAGDVESVEADGVVESVEAADSPRTGTPAPIPGPRNHAEQRADAGPRDRMPTDVHAAVPPAVSPDPVAPAPAPLPPYPEPRTGVAALSLRYQIGAAFALAVVAIAVCVHIGMVFLHVAPQNTVTKQHGKAIDDWIYPEFEQNWKLFAPNPLQQNVAVQVRAEISTGDGDVRTTGWYDLSAQDGRAIDGNLLPSHTQQNELRRAWDFFVATHDAQNRPVGLRGSLSETYLRHIVVLRLDRQDAAGAGGAVERVQVRSRTTNVPPPKWSGEKISAAPTDRVLPWWSVPAAEAGRTAGAGDAEGSAR